MFRTTIKELIIGIIAIPVVLFVAILAVPMVLGGTLMEVFRGRSGNV